MAELIFVAYNGNDINGTALGTLTEAYDKRCGVEDNAVGNGSFSIHPDSSQAAWVTAGNYIKVWRDSISGVPLGGFWIEAGGDVIGSIHEEGGERLQRGGGGPIKVLKESRVWNRSLLGGSHVDRSKARWFWKNAHPARPLVRLLQEAKERGGLQDVTWDFTKTRDSNGVKFASDDFDEWELPIGMSLLEVVGEMRETGLHIVMSPHLVLSVFEEYENDLSGSISFAAGTDIRESSEREIVASRAVSHVLVQGTNKNEQERYRVSNSGTIETALGRRIEGYFSFQRTATRKILGRVGQRKLKKWKQQYDGPFTLGLLDTSGQVAGVDYVVGDTVEVDIPGIYDTEDFRVAGITYVETGSGEYDPIVDFGDHLHDPVTGQYLGGDRSGLNPCGCDGGGPKEGGDKPPPGVPGVTPIDQTQYVLADFDGVATEVTAGFTNGISPSERDLGGAVHAMLLAGGSKALGDFGLAFGAFQSQETGAPAATIYDPIVGQAPIVLDRADSSQATVSADDIDIPLPDGSHQVGKFVFIACTFYYTGAALGTPLAISGWTVEQYDGHGGTPSGRAGHIYRRIDGTEGFSGVNDTIKTVGDAATVDRFWSHAVLLDGVIDLWSPDSQPGVNNSSAPSDTIGSIDPKSGFTNWAQDDIVLWFSHAIADEAISGEHDNYREIASGQDTGLPSSSEAHFVISQHYDNSGTEAPSPDRTFDGPGNEHQLLTAIRGGIGWSFGGTSGDNSYAPSTAWHRVFTADDDHSSVQSVGDFVHYVLRDPDDTDTFTETDIGFATVIANGADAITGTGGATAILNGGPGPAGNHNTIDDEDAGTPDNDDYTFIAWGVRGGLAGGITGDIRHWTAAPPTALGDIVGDWQTFHHVPLRTANGLPANAAAIRVSIDQVNEPDVGEVYAWEDPVGAVDTSFGDGQTFVYAFRGGGFAGTFHAADGGGIGRILTSEENGGSPWPGGHPWSSFFNATGLDDFGLASSSLFVEADSTASNNWSVEVDSKDAPGALPLEGDKWEIEGRYRVTTASVPADAGDRRFRLQWAYSGGLDLRFGDTNFDAGIKSEGEDQTFVAKTLTAAGSWGRFKFLRDGNTFSIKEWAESVTEPDWDITDTFGAAMLEDDTDLTLSGSIGNDGGTAQKFELDWLKVRIIAPSGSSIRDDFVAFGDNSTTKFIIDPFKPGTLIVRVDNFVTIPIAQNPDAGWFRLDRAPYGDPADEAGSSRVTADYEKS